MPEKRRTRTRAGSQVKVQQVATQTTLKNLFQRTTSSTCSTEKAHDLHLEETDPPLQETDPHAPAVQSRLSKPSRQLFPIFTKVSSARDAVLSVDNTEVIDDTDISADIESSTEPHIHQPITPCLEFSQATSRSLPPSPMPHDVDCYENNTSLSYAGSREHTHPRTASKINESNRRTLGFGHVTPFPSSCSQHVRGLQYSYPAGQPPLKRSAFSGFRQPDGGALDFLTKRRQLDDIQSTPLGRVCWSLTPQQCEEHLRSICCDYIESHPVFAQMLVYKEEITSCHTETWTRRFRPRRANEVLGNERHALYLRDWLSALELRLQDRQPASQGATAKENKEKGTLKRAPRGTKRPRVIRAVTKKRGNKRRRVDSEDDNDVDDFVILSDADEDPHEGSEDELAFCQRTLTWLHGRDANEASRVAEVNSVRTDFADNLTNTLLITGPPGCGKTAAVYACAEELGWEVFEVYPGIGRRNGASLDHLVGDVCRNHIVQTVHRRGATKAKEPMELDGYLAKGKVRQFTGFAKPREAGTKGQPINVEDGSPMHVVEPLPLSQEMVSSDEAISEKCHAESEGSRPIVRQSLVLLEEVDILFKEDAGFWPAVIDLIRNCQRPVVMTCNDSGLVPVGDLPLQRVLVFEPCPSPVAATFLQCLSLAEGWRVPHEDLVVLYESTRCTDELDIPDRPDYPRTEPMPLPDLRRSISQLQILCAGARQRSTSEMHQGDEAEGHVRRSGRTISVESRVATPVGLGMASEWWRKMSCHSELMSHVDAQLCKPATAMLEVESKGGVDEEMGYVALSMEGREGLGDELIADEAIRHSRGVHAGPSAASINPAARLMTRVEYQSRMVDALQGILEPPGPLMPQSSVFLDYIPWVRYMVGVDDELERQSWKENGRGGRCTRNSMGTRYVRWVGLSEGQRDMLAVGFI